MPTTDPLTNHHTVPLTLQWGGVAATVWFARFDGHRDVFGYRVTDGIDGSVILAGENLSAPHAPDSAWSIDLPDMMRTLVTFIAAWAEATPGAENADLFPAEARDRLDWQQWSGYLRAHLGGEG